MTPRTDKAIRPTNFIDVIQAGLLIVTISVSSDCINNGLGQKIIAFCLVIIVCDVEDAELSILTTHRF